MQTNPMKKRAFSIVLAWAMLWLMTAAAQEAPVQITIDRKEAGASWIEIPSVTVHPDAAIQEKLNASIYADGELESFEKTLASLGGSGTGLRLRAEAQIIKGKDGLGLLSILFSASGKIGPGRPGHRYIPLMYDLDTGRRITPEDVLIRGEETQTALDTLTAEEIEPSISDYLSPGGLYPVPTEHLMIDESGITFFYPLEDYETLSGASGAVNFHFDELEGLLKREEGSVLAGLELADESEGSAARIQGCVASGSLPGLPLKLGEVLEEVLARYPELHDAETLAGFDRYQLEDARFRGTDVLSEDGAVAAILSHRTNLWGILTGVSKKDDVRAALGQPRETLLSDESASEDSELSFSNADSYIWGEHELRLYYRNDDTLTGVMLGQAHGRR